MNIANEASANNTQDISAKVMGSIKSFQSLAKFASRKSIMTMAQPGMYQYPIIASSAIDTDVLMAITKAYQLTYASSVATAYSLNPIMYEKDTPEVSDFVQRFHVNNPSLLNANLNTASNVLGAESDMTGSDEGDIAVESATIDSSFKKDDLVAASIQAWENIEDSLVMESLNDMYRPYDRTERIMKEKLSALKAANESLEDKLDAFNNTVGDFDNVINSNGNYSTGRPYRNTSKSTESKPVTDKNGNPMKDANGNVITTTTRRTQSQTFVPNQFNNVVRNNQLEALEPTMVNVQIVAHGKDSGQSVHNLTIGVKAMTRLVNSNLMIASMVEACKESHGIFKFLKWTKGELKTLDFILGISDSKKKAIEKNAKQEVRFLEQTRKRKKLNGIGKFVSNEVLPTTSIVITSYEASKIKEACNVDLYDLKNAIKLMNKYYLLSFAIYDTEQNTIQILFDCDADWSYTQIGTIKSVIGKTNDVLNANEVMKVFGRR